MLLEDGIDENRRLTLACRLQAAARSGGSLSGESENMVARRGRAVKRPVLGFDQEGGAWLSSQSTALLQESSPLRSIGPSGPVPRGGSAGRESWCKAGVGNRLLDVAIGVR